MKKSNLIPASVLEKLSQREKFVVNLFLVINICSGIAFILLTAYFFGFQKFFSGLSSFIGTAFTIAAIICLRKGQIKTSQIISFASRILATFIILFMVTTETESLVFYKMISFLIFLLVAETLISSNIKEVLFFYASVSILYVLKVLSIFSSMGQNMNSSMILLPIIAWICMTLIQALLISNFYVIKNIISVALKDKTTIQETLERVTNIVHESKEGLGTGIILSEKATIATEDTHTVLEEFVSIKDSTENIATASLNLSQAFEQLSQDSNKMKEETNKQQESISESSAALTEISANLSNINEITAQRSKNMSDLIEALKSQKTIIEKTLTSVGEVKSSSNSISDFIHTVEEIANQTGLLAMNASIEAAHAGSEGKGFAVIAQEIRKLSEETSKNATKISEALTTNEKTVDTAYLSVNDFAKQVDQNTQEIQDTMQALEGILMGLSEMNAGTQSVMKSMQEIVETAKINGTLVDGVSNSVASQKEEMQAITDSISSLQNSIVETDKKVETIQDVLSDIKNTSDKNVEMSEAINNSLSNINL